jgi:hypothetical protein
MGESVVALRNVRLGLRTPTFWISGEKFGYRKETGREVAPGAREWQGGQRQLDPLRQDIQPRRPGDQRGPDRWRPQHVPARGQAPIQRSTTSSASVRASRAAFTRAAPALMSSPRVSTPSRQY